MPFFLRTLATAIASFAIAVTASAEPKVVPARPLQFEPLHLRITVDSCNFDKSSVSVEMREQRIVATYKPRLCIVPGPPQVVDIELGAYPAGDYQAELYIKGERSPLIRVPFQVVGVASTPPDPVFARPIANFSGLWGATQEPGWGLTVEQSASHKVFGTLYVFDAGRQPQWYTLQAGRWETETRWTGLVVKSEGPPWSDPSYPAEGAQYRSVGTATLDFLMTPEQEDLASFSYTINGQTVEKTIARYRLR
ncbi:MAG: hypothetical protein JNN30_01700 [Rhodanobacteraceae bacterium]|nr:hypothetical protein [Rhodanobacteraceae bacterium]